MSHWPSESLHRTSGILFAIAALTIGAIEAGFLLGLHQINPGNVSWLSGDPAVYQAGWQFLRNAPWRFPPTWLSQLDYPFGISAAYLDVIPLAAIPLKIISHDLPQNFQYLGMYAVSCTILQAYFAFRLMSRFTADRIVIFIGGLFFILSPVFLMRFYGHFSLCSQWLILAALFVYFQPTAAPFSRRLWPFVILLVLSARITPYLSVMVFGIAVAGLFRLWLGTGNPNVARLVAATAILLICLILSLYLFGFLGLGSMPSIAGVGYGSYSMNLVGPVNPSGASLLFRAFPVLPNQSFEGYNYLGDGVIALGVVSLAIQPSLATRLWRPALRPLLILSVLFFVLALSTVVTFEQTVVANVPLPARLDDMLAAFRSSGRFFWPVHYLLILGALVGTLSGIRSRFWAQSALVIALVLQFNYVLPILRSVAKESARSNTTPLIAKDWRMLGKSHAHLVIAPAWQCSRMATPGGTEAWPWFADLAATSGMTLNSVHAARASAPSEEYNCDKLLRDVRQGKLGSDTAYVLLDALAVSAIAHNRTHFCRRVDGFNLCSFDPGDAYRSRLLAARLDARQK